MSDFPQGTVWLVGAGPGDPELLTRKAERLIRAASVIFYDALAGPAILDFAAPGARLVPVGKRSGRHSKDQASIDQLIVAAALAGERVVRLKGGDPAIFARAAEQPFEIRRRAQSARLLGKIFNGQLPAFHRRFLIGQRDQQSGAHMVRGLHHAQLSVGQRDGGFRK